MSTQSGTYENLLVEIDGGVATLTINRPKVLNALSAETTRELGAAIDSLAADEQVGAVIITGAGEKAFVAGADIGVLNTYGPVEAREAAYLGQSTFDKIEECPKPVIAAIHGAAIGVGVTMSLPCDLRIAGEGAKLGLTFTKLGILPGLGSTHLLPRIVGLAKAQELVLTARIIRAPEALEIGLVNRVVPDASLLETAREIAAAIAECDPIALRLAKRALQHGAVSGMAEAMAHEKAASAALRKAKAERTA